MAMLGISELFILMMMSGGMGIPLGVPPEPEDILMARVAPEECLFYTTWSGMATPDPASENHTEQLLAEQEVQLALSQIESKIKEALQAVAEGERSPQAAMAAELVPKWGKLLLTRPACIYVSKVTLNEGGPPDIQGGAVLRVDEHAAEVKAMLEKLQADLVGDGVKKVQIDKGTYFQIQPGPDAPLITWGVRGKYLAVGIGENGLEALFDNARTGPPKWLTDLREQLPLDRTSSVTYANLGKIIDLATAAADDDEVKAMVDVLGLRNLTSYACVTGLDQEGFVNRTVVNVEGEPKGLLAVAAGEPLTGQDLQRIPAASPIAFSVRLDGGKLFDAIVEMVGKIDPRELLDFQAGLAEFERDTGVKFREELIGSLGDVWYVYSSPTEGGLITGWTGVVQVKDRMTLEKVQDKLIAAMRAEFGDDQRSPKIKQLELGDQIAYYVDVPDDDMPFTPTWCLTGNELVFGLFPQSVKAHVTRAADAQSLVDRPDVAQMLEADSRTLAIGYVDTQRMFKLLYPVVQMGLQAALNELNTEGVDLDISILPSPAAIGKHLQPSISAARRTKAGFEFEAHQTLPGGSIGASAPVMVALLLPAVQAARTAARRSQGANNLKQIALAMHNYHDVFRGFPPAYNTDKDGKPLLSWRVHILPFMEQQALYERFHLDEPWDSEHNKALIPLMPQTLRSAASTAEPGMTTYLGVRGKNTVLAPPADAMKGKDKGATGMRFADITDGTSNTILLVEASDRLAVPWTKPDDFTPDDDNPVKGLPGLYGPGFQAAFADGSVHYLSDMIDADVLKNLFQRNDGNVIDYDELNRR